MLRCRRTLRLSGSPKLLRIEAPLRRVRSKRLFGGALHYFETSRSSAKTRECLQPLITGRIQLIAIDIIRFDVGSEDDELLWFFRY